MYPSPQVIENVILIVTGLLLTYLFQRLVRATETISLVLRLAQPSSNAVAKVPVLDAELEAFIRPDARYSKFHMPNSLRPFKDTDYQ